MKKFSLTAAEKRRSGSAYFGDDAEDNYCVAEVELLQFAYANWVQTSEDVAEFEAPRSLYIEKVR